MPPRLPTEAKDRRESRGSDMCGKRTANPREGGGRGAVLPRCAQRPRSVCAPSYRRDRFAGALRRLHPATDYRDVDKCFMDDFRDNDT